MKQFWVMLIKEWKEALRSYKVIWIPVAFMLLGAMQPLTTYYMDTLLETLGGLPEGTVFEVPLPGAAEVLTTVHSQFNQIGVLILVLAFMGILTAERQQETHIMVLAKPVSIASFVLAKLVYTALFSTGAYAAGMLFGTYYTIVLFGNVPAGQITAGALVFLLWLVFIAVLLILFSSFMKSSGAVAFLTIASALFLHVTASMFPETLQLSPGMLALHSNALLVTGEPLELFAGSMTVSILAILIFPILSCILFRKQKLA
ncbi:ABC transporter permease [Alkalicoccus daliensis]|uniref:ABC-2 type transport system permease protein n=1 Tax=Alkalicoccus daliensis TaxID=745820 RepID=A0A1H0GSX3_9BACI|nr:ABC transporter permease subunit [Alkalicoccus daliensis]SDO09960.1 ABC-2 type transport system permease protein [Alkalicoccus daliensis]